MADFKTILSVLKEGHKIRRKSSNQIFDIESLFGIEDLDACDWEIYENNKDWCLNEEGQLNSQFNNDSSLYMYDEKVYFVKDKVKKMLDLIIEDMSDYDGGFGPVVSKLKQVIETRSGL